MRKWLARPAVVAAMTVGLMLVLVAPASAGGATQIAGDGMVLGDAKCNDQTSLLTLELTDGNLVGCWYTTAFTDFREHPSGTVQERGEEEFVGSYYDDGKWVGEGSFTTTYHFTGKFDAEGEVFGRCQHPIVEGTGVFEGISGRVDFKDVEPRAGILEYRGHIKFPNGA